MRILIIGGAGEMGQYACRALTNIDAVAELIVADLDRDRAAATADELGGKAAALGLDVLDHDALKAAVSDADIVLNTAGPFYRLGRPVLEAALDAGANYLDICDDWEPTLEMLELDDRAKEAGVTAIIGMGASPGTSNLLAAKAVRECDTVVRLFTAWRAGAGVPRPAPGGPPPKRTAALDHWVHNCSDPIKLWRDGKLVEAYGLEEMKLRYPGRGEETVWVCGHPEPITTPRTFPELRESVNLMTSRRGLMDAMKRVASRVRSGELDVHEAGDTLLFEPNMWGSAAGPAPSFPDIFAVAEGIKDGEPVRVGAQALAVPEANMGEHTGIPLAVATTMVVEGTVDRPGVYGPEGAIDPDIYFEKLAQYATARPEGGKLVEVLTEAREGESA